MASQPREAGAVSPLSGDVQPAAGASTSEQRCPVCLEDFEDKAFVDSCFHVFCFACIVQWSEVANSCPMCKTSFCSIIHNVQANDNYEKFEIKSKATPSHQEISLNAARRFHYRTTRFSGQQRERRRRDSRKPAVNERRRMVYSSGLWALPMETTGEKRARVRNISASFFRENPACTHRLVPWLNRELTVLLGKEHVDFMMQIIMSLIDKVDLESAEFAQHIEPFLHEKTAHFMHEFVSFAKSPFDMIAYDRRVRYEWPRSLRPPDNWDPEATQQQAPLPGPSGLSGMQQRIFEELTATRWDDSPPFLPTTATSPIVIHGSDSEPEEEEPRLSSFHSTTQSSVHPSFNSTVHPSTHPPTVHPSTHPPTVQPSTHPPIVQSSTHTTIVQPSTHPPTVHPSTHTTIVQPSTHTTIVQPSIYTTFVRPSTHPPTIQPMQLSANTSGSSSQLVPSTRATEEGTVADILTTSAASEGPGPSQGHSRGGINSTTVDLISSPEVTTTETSAAATEIEGQRSLEKEEEAEVEESYAVSIHGENMDDLDMSGNGSFMSQLDDERSLLARKKGEKHVNLERKRSHSYSKAESDQRRYSSRHRERDRGKHGRERLHDQWRKSESDDSDSYRRRRRRRRQYDRREHGGGRSHVHERYFGSHDYERHTDLYHASSSFYQREKERHRSRLYSDDYPQTRSYPGGSRGRSESRRRSSDSDGPVDRFSSKRRRRRRRASGSHGRSQHFEERRERRRYHSEEREEPQQSPQRLKSEVRKATYQDPAQKRLAEELSELDAEIKENKKKLLKSLLHRERLELLHRSLHEEQLSSDMGPSTHEIEPVSISPSTPTVEIVRELSYLDRAIIDGKKQLLRVMKKMEEERAEESMDSN